MKLKKQLLSLEINNFPTRWLTYLILLDWAKIQIFAAVWQVPGSQSFHSCRTSAFLFISFLLKQIVKRTHMLFWPDSIYDLAFHFSIHNIFNFPSHLGNPIYLSPNCGLKSQPRLYPIYLSSNYGLKSQPRLIFLPISLGPLFLLALQSN